MMGDRPVHKILCSTFKAFGIEKAPPDHYRGIFFPEREDKPRFVWVHQNSNGMVRPESLMDDNLPGVNVEVLEEGQYNLLLDRLHQPMRFLAQGRYGSDGRLEMVGERNASMGTIDKELDEDIRGPVLFHGLESHLDMMDFRHAVDYLRIWFVSRFVMEAPESISIEGVRINCIGDILIAGRPPFEAWKVPYWRKIEANPVVCDEELEIPMAELIGLPLRTHMLPDMQALSWRQRNIRGIPYFSYENNISYSVMNPSQWLLPVGSIVVTRKNYQALHPGQIEALCRYCNQVAVKKVMNVDVLPETPPGHDILYELHAQFSLVEREMRRKANRRDYLLCYVQWMNSIPGKYYGEHLDFHSED
jgi:hypothetical protein